MRNLTLARFVLLSLLPAAMLIPSACGGDDGAPTATPTAPLASSSASVTASPSLGSPSPTGSPVTPAASATLTLTSTAFASGASIPAGYTCDGAGGSPPLAWAGVPSAAKGLVLILDDPDAPGVFVHWVAYAIPADKTGFEAAVSPKAGGQLPYGQEGTNGAGRPGYTGPCPPKPQEHHYSFRLYAVDAPVVLGPGANAKADVEKAMAGHIIAQAELVALYKRP